MNIALNNVHRVQRKLAWQSWGLCWRFATQLQPYIVTINWCVIAKHDHVKEVMLARCPSWGEKNKETHAIMQRSHQPSLSHDKSNGKRVVWCQVFLSAHTYCMRGAAPKHPCIAAHETLRYSSPQSMKISCIIYHSIHWIYCISMQYGDSLNTAKKTETEGTHDRH